MIHHHELTQHYKAMQLERSCRILCQIAVGTLSNLVFIDERKFGIKIGSKPPEWPTLECIWIR